MRLKLDELGFWRKIRDSLENNIKVVIMIVAESIDSSPGRAGFKMAVFSSGELFGSVGGGIMEYDLAELARKKILKSDSKTELINLIHNENNEKSSGMICSGSQKIIMLPVPFDKINTILEINQALEKSYTFTLEISNSGFETSNYIPLKQFELSYVSADEWKYREFFGERKIIYIFGGGHVSLALSRIMQTLGFYIIVIDPRDDINTFKNNNYANEKICKGFDSADSIIKEGENVYAVIMTRGHMDDELVLEKIIRKKIKYLGMMGSKNKVAELFERLKKKEISQEELKRVKSPIGLDISSETPEEIAISIAAEIIKISKYQ